MSNYAVGDIQGCYDELCQLLDLVNFSTASDRLWCVGDMINRGPQSLATLRFLRELGPAYTGVLGNHDLHFLALSSGACDKGKVDSLRHLLDAPDCGELYEWARQLPLAHRERLATDTGEIDFLMVHAGIAPDWTFSTAVALAEEVAKALRADDHRHFLAAMYGNKPDRFKDSLSGDERLRVITNVLTRMRFCSPRGQLDFAVKTAADDAPAGFRPWFEFQQLPPDARLLFGHWAMLNGKTRRSDIIGLDTGCVWGRAMTLLELETGRQYQVSCRHVEAL